LTLTLSPIPEPAQEALDGIRALIRHIGDDPDREGLIATPERVLRAWAEYWGRGYAEIDPTELLRLFDPLPSHEFATQENAIHANYNEMVVVRDIAMYSHCEHHLTPFFGSAHIAYVPSRKGIVGISKLARVVDHFSRRLQVQERLCTQIADFLAAHLSLHVGIMIEARHFCMISRGVQQPHAITITTALKGNLFADPKARAEFLAACRAKS
jgi:GTP cyclohydrolase I